MPGHREKVWKQWEAGRLPPTSCHLEAHPEGSKHPESRLNTSNWGGHLQQLRGVPGLWASASGASPATTPCQRASSPGRFGGEGWNGTPPSR